MTIQTAFSSYQGEDVLLPITIYEADGTTPQNITGWGLEFVAHPMSTTDPVVIESTANGNMTITDGPNGLASISIPGTDSALMTPADYLFFVKRTDVGGQAVLTSGVWSFLQP